MPPRPSARAAFSSTLCGVRILDRFGNPLAYTTDAQDITVDPKILRTAGITGDKLDTYSAELAPLVGKSAADVSKILSAPGEYGVLAQALEPLAAQKVTGLDLVGVYTQATTLRQYPGQTTAANVVGLVHSDGTGAAGIEQQYNSVLAGTNGDLTYTTDGNGTINPNGVNTQTKAINGGTVRLTLDQSLQYVVQQDADAAVKASGARGADVAILSAKTGQVLALASSGTFNSADPSTLSSDVSSNPAIQAPFEPGSVNKLVTFSAAVDKGMVTPSTVVDVPSSLPDGGVVVHDAWTHPDEQFTATGVLAESSNIGTVQVANKIGPQTWFDYEKAFGIGSPTGIELPGESAGYLPAMNTWSASTFANLPFGQGLSMTVLQMAGMYQTIANNGVRIEPRIVSSVTNPDASTVVTKQPAGVQVVKPSTAQNAEDDARVDDAHRGHWNQGRDRGLPGLGQDRHRAAARSRARRRLQQLPELGHVRRHRARRQPAVRRRDHGRRSGPRAGGWRRRRPAVP